MGWRIAVLALFDTNLADAPSNRTVLRNPVWLAFGQSQAWLTRSLLSYGAVGILAFVALFIVLTNGENESHLHAMHDAVLSVSVQATGLTSTAEAMLGSQDLELRAQRFREFQELIRQFNTPVASADFVRIRQRLPALSVEVDLFRSHAESVARVSPGTVQAEDQLDALASAGRGSLGLLLQSAIRTLSHDRHAIAQDRQRLLLIVLVVFFGALVGGAYVVLSPAKASSGPTREANGRAAVSSLAEAMESLDEGIALFEADGSLAYCNERYRSAYAAGSVKIKTGDRYQEVLSSLVSQGFFRDAKGGEETWLRSRLEKFHEVGEPQMEYLSDGRCLQVSSYRAPGGGVLSLIADVTEAERRDAARQVNEARTRASIATVFDGIVTFNDEGVIEGFNPAAESIFGVRSEDAVGASIRLIMPEKYQDATDEQISTFLTEQIRRYTGGVHEVEGRRRNGVPFPLEIAVEEVPDSWSMLERRRARRRVFIASVRDITERKELADQLQQSQKMQAIGTLAGGIAHDFNNILSVILGYTSLVLDDKEDDDDARENLEMVMQAGRRARDLVEQILTFSRRSDRAKETVALKPTVEEVLKLLRSTLATTIEIQQYLAGAPGCWSLRTRRQIHQVLMNLCTNAAQAMDTGEGVLTVSLEPTHLDDATAQRLGLQSGPYHRRKVINGVMYILSTGCQWRALPKDLPPEGAPWHRLPRPVEFGMRHSWIESICALASSARRDKPARAVPDRARWICRTFRGGQSSAAQRRRGWRLRLAVRSDHPCWGQDRCRQADQGQEAACSGRYARLLLLHGIVKPPPTFSDRDGGLERAAGDLVRSVCLSREIVRRQRWIRGRSFTAPWPASCPSRPRSSSDLG